MKRKSEIASTLDERIFDFYVDFLLHLPAVGRYSILPRDTTNHRGRLGYRVSPHYTSHVFITGSSRLRPRCATGPLSFVPRPSARARAPFHSSTSHVSATLRRANQNYTSDDVSIHGGAPSLFLAFLSFFVSPTCAAR